MTTNHPRVFTLRRGIKTGDFVTPKGHNVRFVSQDPEVFHNNLTRTGLLSSRRFVVCATGRRYASMDAAIAAIIKATKE
jgi:hypothetical protein